MSHLLMAIGGGGMLAVAGYESLRTDPEEFTYQYHYGRLKELFEFDAASKTQIDRVASN